LVRIVETKRHKTRPWCTDKLPLLILCNFSVITFTGNANISLVEVFENPVDRIWNFTTGRPPHSPYQAYVLPEVYSGEYVGVYKYLIAVTAFI
jgi:hypothetical protein